jgi:hypothetical protein
MNLIDHAAMSTDFRALKSEAGSEGEIVSGRWRLHDGPVTVR